MGAGVSPGLQNRVWRFAAPGGFDSYTLPPFILQMILTLLLALPIPTTVSLKDWCEANEVRLAVPNVRLGTTLDRITEEEIVWLTAGQVVDARAGKTLTRSEEQTDQLARAEQERQELMRREWLGASPPNPSSTADQIIRSLCEAEATREANFTSKTIDFIRQRLRRWLQSQMPPLSKLTGEKPGLVETDLKIPAEELAVFQEVYRSADLWEQYGQRAGLELDSADHLRQLFGRLQGQPQRVFWRSMTTGWVATGEFVQNGALTGSQSTTFRLMPPSPEPILPRSAEVMVPVPLSAYLAAPSLSARRREDALATVQWPGWLAKAIAHAAERPVAAWFPEEVAGEVFLHAIETRQAEIDAEVILDAVERWCEVKVLPDRILVRPRWIRATETRQISPAHYELMARALEDEAHLSPRLLGGVTLASEWLGYMHPAEIFLGRLLQAEVEPYRPDWWLAAAAGAAGMTDEWVAFHNLPLAIRDRIKLDVPSLRFYLLANHGPIPESEELSQKLAESSRYSVITGRERTWEIEDARIWGLGERQLPGLLYSEGVVGYLRQRYEGHVGGPKAFPGVMLTKTLAVRTPHGDLSEAYVCNWGFSRTGDAEPLVGRPAR